jgi:hypothetical protein
MTRGRLCYRRGLYADPWFREITVGTTVPRLGVARTHGTNTLAMIGKGTQPFVDVL